jgi:hypothetical protein
MAPATMADVDSASSAGSLQEEQPTDLAEAAVHLAAAPTDPVGCNILLTARRTHLYHLSTTILHHTIVLQHYPPPP